MENPVMVSRLRAGSYNFLKINDPVIPVSER